MGDFTGICPGTLLSAVGPPLSKRSFCGLLIRAVFIAPNGATSCCGTWHLRGNTQTEQCLHTGAGGHHRVPLPAVPPSVRPSLHSSHPPGCPGVPLGGAELSPNTSARGVMGAIKMGLGACGGKAWGGKEQGAGGGRLRCAQGMLEQPGPAVTFKFFHFQSFRARRGPSQITNTPIKTKKKKKGREREESKKKCPDAHHDTPLPAIYMFPLPSSRG